MCIVCATPDIQPPMTRNDVKQIVISFALFAALTACATGQSFEQMKMRSTDLARAAAAGEMSCPDVVVEQSGGGENSREFTARGCGKVLQYQTVCDDKECNVVGSKDITPAAAVDAPPSADAPPPNPAPVATPVPVPTAAEPIFTGKMVGADAWRKKLVELASNEMTCPTDKLTVTAPAAGVEGTHKLEGCSKFVQYTLDCGDDGACSVFRK
jgi:hypothetical protein